MSNTCKNNKQEATLKEIEPKSWHTKCEWFKFLDKKNKINSVSQLYFSKSLSLKPRGAFSNRDVTPKVTSFPFVCQACSLQTDMQNWHQHIDRHCVTNGFLNWRARQTLPFRFCTHTIPEVLSLFQKRKLQFLLLRTGCAQNFGWLCDLIQCIFVRIMKSRRPTIPEALSFLSQVQVASCAASEQSAHKDSSFGWLWTRLSCVQA